VAEVDTEVAADEAKAIAATAANAADRLRLSIPARLT
jgi:hypothetical protein